VWRADVFGIALLLLAGAPPATAQEKAPADEKQREQARSSRARSVERLIEEVAASGRVLALAQHPSERLRPREKLAPGSPPILAFRYLDGKRRHRFGDLDLVMDDAGH